MDQSQLSWISNFIWGIADDLGERGENQEESDLEEVEA